MIDQFYYQLDLNFLSDEGLLNQPEHFSDHHVRWLTDSVDTELYLHNDVKQLYKQLGLNINSYLGNNTMSLFKGSPGEYLEPHIDRGTCWAINCVLGSTNSDMVWYQFANGVTVDDGYEIPTSNGRASYKAFRPQQLVEQSRACLYGVYLVRIDLPHSVHNYDTEHSRWCFSLKDAGNRWSWHDTIEYFRPYMYA